ncbi:MAG: class I SAM-dependent methyltransferase [Acidobacteriota bacterium]
MRQVPGPSVSIPPGHLLQKVGSTDDQSEYRRMGLISAHTVENFLGRQGLDWRRLSSWLDLACGCGRTLNFLRFDLAPSRLSGCDYDSSLIEWCRNHLRGIRFEHNQHSPPLPFAERSFEVIYSISFFTHLDETAQQAWLKEIQRILKPNGAVMLSLHGEALALRRNIHLPSRGFKHHRAGPAFNEQVTYQTEEYVRREWGRDFEVLAYESLALDSFQDLVLLAPLGGTPDQGQPVLPHVPKGLKEVWERRPDLHRDFDSRGIGKSDSPWRNLSLVDWAMLNGHQEMQELRKYGPGLESRTQSRL